MNWRAIKAIVRKDLKVVVQNKSVLLPMIILPFIFLVLLPAGSVFLMSNEAALQDMQDESAAFLNNMPAGMKAELDQFETEQQKWIYLLVNYQFAPFFLIIPLMIASVIGADSFVGETERKTMEGLIYTPITDFELYLAKMLVAWIPAAVISFAGGILYSLVANVASASIMDGIFFPNLMWIVLILWVAPAAAGLGLATIVLVSSRAKTFQEASQMSGMVVVPVILLVVSQFAGVLYFNVQLALILGLIVWIVVIGLLWVGAKTFQRGEIIARL